MEKIEDLPRYEEAYTTYEPLDELIGRHHPDNPKDHSIGDLIISIQEFGFVRNVMINEIDNLLLYGHGTTEALWQMYESGEYQVPKRIKVNDDGMWLVPTDRGIRLSKKRAKAYVVADNRHGELGGWLEGQLVDNLIAIAGKDGRGLRGTGYDGDELDTLIRMYRPELIETPEDPGAQIDKAAELQKKWKVKRGQIWEIGSHRLMCGDCTSDSDVGILKDSVDMIFTDPPYCSGGFQETGKASGSVGTRGTEMVARDTLSTRGYQALIRRALELANVGIAYVFTDWRMWIYLFDLMEAQGFGVRNMIVWDKGTPGMGVGWRSQHELIMCAIKVKRPFNPKKAQGNVIQSQRTGNVLHAVEKPVDLLRTIIEVNDLVETIYDPFLGSGSTMVAVEQTSRICYGMEVTQRYCAVTLERMLGMGFEPKLI